MIGETKLISKDISIEHFDNGRWKIYFIPKGGAPIEVSECTTRDYARYLATSPIVDYWRDKYTPVKDNNICKQQIAFTWIKGLAAYHVSTDGKTLNPDWQIEKVDKVTWQIVYKSAGVDFRSTLNKAKERVEQLITKGEIL
jgi:hypothetical protein